MNKVLERQLKKAFGSIENVPKGLEEFLKAVSDTYDHSEEDRLMIEHSMELSSKEMGELNQKLTQESGTFKKNLDDLARMNKLMIDREIKMIELKKRIAELEGLKNTNTQ